MTDNKRVRKYRAWIIEDKKMMYGDSAFMMDPEAGIIQYADQGYYCNNADAAGEHLERLKKAGIEPKDEFILMDFTGLSDKNKKEIYEGDILCPFLEAIGPYWVVFENGSFVCYHKLGRWGLLSKVFEADILRDYSVEVIGNIYENPELLEK